MTDTSREAVERAAQVIRGNDKPTVLLSQNEAVALLGRIEALTAEVDLLRKGLNTAWADRDMHSAARAKAVAEIAALKVAQIDAIRAALDAAATCCDDEADRCDDAAIWSGSARYKQDCKAAAYAMRDRSSAIRALDPATIAAKLKGDGNDR